MTVGRQLAGALPHAHKGFCCFLFTRFIRRVLGPPPFRRYDVTPQTDYKRRPNTLCYLIMSSQVQDTFDVVKEANQAAHEALHKREAQGLERDGPLEQAAARDIEGIAREFLGTSS